MGQESEVSKTEDGELRIEDRQPNSQIRNLESFDLKS